MSPADCNNPSPWRDVQIEAAANFSALCLQIGSGRYPWDEQPAQQAPAAPVKAASPGIVYDLLIV